MNRPQQPPESPWSRTRLDAQVFNVCFLTVSAMSVLCVVLVMVSAFAASESSDRRAWPEALALMSLTAATLLGAARHLPGQNILLAAGLIGVTGAGLHGMSAATALPFGPITFTLRIGPRWMEIFPWVMPLLWMVAVFNSRGVARLILRPWRKLKNYGLWLIAVTTLLVVLFDLALEPFATHAREYWIWHQTKLPWTWHGMPVVNPVAWGAVTVLILSFTTPVLIGKKQRPSKSPPDYFPLAAWLACVVMFGVGAAAEKLWLAAGFCGALTAATTVFAVRGARW
jgi:uncharacterized membrane protein